MWWLQTSLALSGPGPEQTPCAWLLSAENAGFTTHELAWMALTHSEQFSRADRKCVKAASLPKPVQKALRGRESEATILGRTEWMTDRFDISIQGAVIGPVNTGRGPQAAWDGLKKPVDPKWVEGMVGLAQISTLVPLAVAAPLVAYAGGEIGRANSPPDVYGELSYEGRFVPSELGEPQAMGSAKKPCRNTFYCLLSGELQGVRVQSGDRIRVTLWDADRIDQDDVVASIALTRDEVLAAAELEGDVFVPLREVTSERLYGLVITSRRSRVETPEATR